ncbi:uncharacterized protein LOC143449477 [Clavelina lepadiformis]
MQNCMEMSRNHNVKLNDRRKMFLYPKPPDQLELFSAHGFVSRPKTAAVTYLERMLSKTALTTQKATHTNIEDIGARIHEKERMEHQEEKEFAVLNAIKQTKALCQKKHEKVLAAAMQKAEKHKQKLMEQEKMYYEQLAIRIKLNRDELENEKIQQVIRKKDEEKENALLEQWEKAEQLKREAIERCLKEQHKKLRADATLERENSIARALRVAKEHSRIQLEESVELAKKECAKIASENVFRMEQLHKVEIQRLNERVARLTSDSKLHEKRKKVAQRDYINIEDDYSNFLDVTTHVPCHSDYLISPRKLKHGIARCRSDNQSQTNLISLDQKSKVVQTDVQILARK